jgi:hypothetical protein
MKFPKFAVLTATMALSVAPAFALASGSGDHPTGQPETTPVGPPSTTPVGPPATTPPTNQGTEHKPSTPGPKASLPAKAKAYGKYCQGQSKTHVAGTPGTPFSKCVTNLARLATGSVKTPLAACKDESKKHVAGQHGTPFSLCVSGAAKLLKSEHAS